MSEGCRAGLGAAEEVKVRDMVVGEDKQALKHALWHKRPHDPVGKVFKLALLLVGEYCTASLYHSIAIQPLFKLEVVDL